MSGLHNKFTTRLDLPCFTEPTINSNDGGCGKCGCKSANLLLGGGSFTLYTLGGFLVFLLSIIILYI